MNNDAPLFLITTCETTYVCMRDVTNVRNKDIYVSPPILSDGSGSVHPRAALLYVLLEASQLYTQGAKDRLPAPSVPRTPAEGYLHRFSDGLGSARMRQDWKAGMSLDAAASSGGDRSRVRSPMVLSAASGTADDTTVPDVDAPSGDIDAAGSSATDGQDSRAGCAEVSGATDTPTEVDMTRWCQLAASAGTSEAIDLLPTYGHADVGWTDDCVAASTHSMVVRVRAPVGTPDYCRASPNSPAINGQNMAATRRYNQLRNMI